MQHAGGLFRHCRLAQGTHHAHAWLRDDRAVLGDSVSLPEVSGLWTITEVGERAKSGVALRAMNADVAPLPRPVIELDQFPGAMLPAPDVTAVMGLPA